MAEPYLGEVRIFAGNFAPDGWQLCNGQLVSIAENTALFSLLGTFYGGNGTSTFALPNMQGNFPMHPGTGTGVAAGLATVLGQTGGSATVSLLTSNMPAHSHSLEASGNPPTSGNASLGVLSSPLRSAAPLYTTAAPSVPLNPTSVGLTGNGTPFSRGQPYLAVSFIIAMNGIYPSRN